MAQSTRRPLRRPDHRRGGTLSLCTRPDISCFCVDIDITGELRPFPGRRRADDSAARGRRARWDSASRPRIRLHRRAAAACRTKLALATPTRTVLRRLVRITRAGCTAHPAPQRQRRASRRSGARRARAGPLWMRRLRARPQWRGRARRHHERRRLPATASGFPFPKTTQSCRCSASRIILA